MMRIRGDSDPDPHHCFFPVSEKNGLNSRYMIDIESCLFIRLKELQAYKFCLNMEKRG